MGRVPPRALEQGELDGLCGIHSMINSLNWALHSLRHSRSGARRLAGQLKEKEREDIFGNALRLLPHHRAGLSPVVDGVSGAELARLLKECSAWVQAKRGLRLGISRPFYRQSNVTTGQLRLVLSEHLSKPGTAAIIGVEPPWQHWTVVVRVTAKRFTLLDSSGDSYLPLRKCGRPSGRQGGRLRTGNIFLLQISREKRRKMAFGQ